jgi:thiamine biosynthesis lipoprotein
VYDEIHAVPAALIGASMQFFLIFCCLALHDGAPGHSLLRFEYDEPHLGTRCRLVFYARDRGAADRAAQAAFDRIRDLEGVMSDYQPTSELGRLCAAAGGPAVPVSADLFAVLECGIKVSERSRGAFDVSIGPLTHLWRRSSRTGSLPNQKQIDLARSLVDYRAIELDPEHRTVRLAKKGMLLDLGGIGKGYAADEALAVLHRRGIDSALVAAGGDIALGSPPPGKPGWRIGLIDLGGTESGRLALHDAAISTSADTEQHLDIDGERRSHIIDPRLGFGITQRRSVTVVAPKGVWADSLTKVGSIMDPSEALQIVASFPGAAARITCMTKNGTAVYLSERFPRETPKRNSTGD